MRTKQLGSEIISTWVHTKLEYLRYIWTTCLANAPVQKLVIRVLTNIVKTKQNIKFPFNDTQLKKYRNRTIKKFVKIESWLFLIIVYSNKLKFHNPIEL